MWWREIEEDAREAEEWWLAANVYGSGLRAKALGPVWAPISARERFA